MILIQISEITITPRLRSVLPEEVQKMAKSMKEVGLINPITIDKRYTLIAGLHRLEAAKLLGWVEINCNVSDLDGLASELAEIDENFVRCDLPTIDHNDIVMRRKELYEALHPDTKNGGDRKSKEIRTTKCRSDSEAFTRDTASKMNVSPRTVERQVQAAKNTTEEAKQILRKTNTNITQKDALELSRLEPEQQIEAATLLADGKIRKVNEYVEPKAALPFQMTQRTFSSFEEGVADLKNTEKDCSCTPGDFLAEVTAFVLKFHKEIEWFNNPYYEVVFPDLNAEQLDYLRQQMEAVSTAAKKLYKSVERNAKK